MPHPVIEMKWIINNNAVFIISNLTLEGFNTAVENHDALCIFNNVVFKDNKMDYISDKDYGAAIFNFDTVMCFNCSFINNYAKYGGAIYNKDFLVLQNCSFADNTGYGSGNDVVTIGSGIVVIDGKRINGSDGPVKHLDENLKTRLWINIIGGLAAVISFIPGFVGAAIAAKNISLFMVGFICYWCRCGCCCWCRYWYRCFFHS